MCVTEAIVKMLVWLGFRAPGEPSRKELRAKIGDAVAEGQRHANAIPTAEERRERTGEMRAPAPNVAH